MSTCPDCQGSLLQTKSRNGVYSCCQGCGGRSATVALLRRKLERPIVNSLWQKALNGSFPKHKQCFGCGTMMSEVSVDCDDGFQLIDVCTHCHTVWFDSGEYEKFPKLPEPKNEYTGMSMKAREAIANMKIERINAQAEAEKCWDGEPEEWWQWILAFFGMPIEHDRSSIKIPYLTWLFALLVIVISVASFSNLQAITGEFGLIPAELSRYSGLTFITSIFLHADYVHLLSNMYFFIIFGDDVEESLGWFTFIMLLFSAAVAGGLAHCLVDPRAQIPCIGASGAISGVMAYYALQFPKNKIGLMLILFRYAMSGKPWIYVKISAVWMFIIWVGLQIFGVSNQIAGISNVSAVAHVGGASVGICFWLIKKYMNSESMTPKNAGKKYNKGYSK